MITVTQRVYRDASGRPTTDKGKAVSLMYPEGAEITEAQARAAGIAVESKDVKGPTESKDIKGPSESK